jgi:hypothetical protein
MPRKKKILIHILAWAIWYLMVCSWALFSWNKQPLCPSIYNLTSLIIVFYSIRWAAGRYWKKIEKETKMQVDNKGILRAVFPNYRYYIMQWPVVIIVLIVFSYIVASWFMQNFFEAHGLAEPFQVNFYYYTYSRWQAESLYVICANIMAAIEYHFRKEKEQNKHLEELLTHRNDRLLRYDRTLKKYFDSNKDRFGDAEQQQGEEEE